MLNCHRCPFPFLTDVYLEKSCLPLFVSPLSICLFSFLPFCHSSCLYSLILTVNLPLFLSVSLCLSIHPRSIPAILLSHCHSLSSSPLSLSLSLPLSLSLSLPPS